MFVLTVWKGWIPAIGGRSWSIPRPAGGGPLLILVAAIGETSWTGSTAALATSMSGELAPMGNDQSVLLFPALGPEGDETRSGLTQAA